jgi:ribonuclease D
MLYKVQYLRQAYNLVVRNWFDIPCQACLANPTRYRNVANLSIQNMVSMDFSKQYIKPSNFLQSDWRSNILPIDKVKYATLDCFFAYKFAIRVSNFPRPN